MLGDSNPVYYKTETIMLFLNYLSSKVGENKIGEQSTFRGQTVLLTKEETWKEKNGINYAFPRQEEELLRATLL